MAGRKARMHVKTHSYLLLLCSYSLTATSFVNPRVKSTLQHGVQGALVTPLCNCKYQNWRRSGAQRYENLEGAFLKIAPHSVRQLEYRGGAGYTSRLTLTRSHQIHCGVYCTVGDAGANDKSRLFSISGKID
jgi:hypothetical protein